jgi:transglutaminase-like putative cysteine protease
MLDAIVLSVSAVMTPPPAHAAVRAFEASYVATVQEVPAGLGRLEGWVPIPSDSADQTIRNLKVESPYPGEIRQESEHGDRYFYFSTDAPKSGPLDIRVTFEAERREAGRGEPRRESETELAKYLRAESLVTISPRIRAIARQVTFGHTTPESKARAIYDYIVATMTYDKTTPGWGQGDTERACDVQKGNCTDIHSFLMSLARAEGIPARFVIGFPLKPDPEGTVPGYHCWSELYLPGRGWTPVDASDASKTTDPKKRDYLFGHLDPDRVQFSIGRDIRLDPPPCAETLNYFIYPYVEGNGKAITPVAIRLDYRNVSASAPTGGGASAPGR